MTRQDVETAILAFLSKFVNGGEAWTGKLAPYIDCFEKPEADPGFWGRPRYSIDLVNGAGCYKKYEGLVYDAEYNAVLMSPMGFWRSPRPIACLSFDRDAKEDEALIVRQIQGATLECVDFRERIYYPRVRRALRMISWERMMLAWFLDQAFGRGVPTARTIKAEGSEWYKRPSAKTPVSEIQRRMRMRYDVTAKRLGFEEDSRSFLIRPEKWRKRREIIFNKAQASR